MSWVRRGLRQIVAIRTALDTLEPLLVVAARKQGATWAHLAADLGITPQGARQRHVAVDPIAVRRSTRPQTIDDFHAEFVAAMRAEGREIA